MADTPDEKKVIDEFLALTDHAKRCEAYHDPAKNGILSRLFAAHNFPKPEPQPASN